MFTDTNALRTAKHPNAEKGGIYTGWGQGLESQVLMLCAPGLWLEAVFLLN